MNSFSPRLNAESDPYDHRVLGTRLDLFHQQEEGPGMVFWHPRGFALYRVIEDYVRRRMREVGFAEIRTPQLLSYSLWEQSGHADKFANEMYRLDSRSSALRRAVRLLREAELGGDYADAWDEWNSAGEHEAWDRSVGDGLGPPTA